MATAKSTKSTTPVAKKETSKKVTLEEVIDVQSCVVGKLIWTSPRTANKIVWNEFGEKNPISVSELLDMRNSSRALFEKNYIVLCGERATKILEYLQLEKFYKDIQTVDDIDGIFKNSPEDIRTIIDNLPASAKETVGARASTLISEGVIDSFKVITAIEEATGYRFN